MNIKPVQFSYSSSGPPENCRALFWFSWGLNNPFTLSCIQRSPQPNQQLQFGTKIEKQAGISGSCVKPCAY